MKVRAQAKSIKSTPRKFGLVAGLVRMRSVADSLAILEHTPKKAARQLTEVIKSAQANAENNFKLDADSLIVDSILVGPGPILKRFRAGPMGRAMPVKFRTTNVTVILDEITPRPTKPVSTTKPKSKVK